MLCVLTLAKFHCVGAAATRITNPHQYYLVSDKELIADRKQHIVELEVVVANPSWKEILLQESIDAPPEVVLVGYCLEPAR